MRSKKTRLLLLLLFSLASVIFSLRLGSGDFLPHATPKLTHFILYNLRLPRTEAAFLTGASLALAGCLMQLLLQNPLADPYILGLSSGASVGALLASLIGGSLASSFMGAWLGSLVTMLLLLIFTAGIQPERLLLLGVALTGGLAALTSLLTLFLPPEHARPLLYWLAGDLSYAHPTPSASFILLAALIGCLYLAPGFNVLSRGSLEAQTLGLPVSRYRLGLYLLSALLTASAITLAGCIGFIGLITPHLTRKYLGSDHRALLPGALLLGGSLLVFADTLARTLFAPIQLPVGLCMVLIGIPFLLKMLTP